MSVLFVEMLSMSSNVSIARPISSTMSAALRNVSFKALTSDCSWFKILFFDGFLWRLSCKNIRLVSDTETKIEMRLIVSKNV